LRPTGNHLLEIGQKCTCKSPHHEISKKQNGNSETIFFKKGEIEIKQLVFVCVFTYQRVLLVVLSVCPTFTDDGGTIPAVAWLPDRRERLIGWLATIQAPRSSMAMEHC